MKSETGRKNVSYKIIWPKTRYYSIINGETYGGVRLRLDLIDNLYCIVVAVFDFETDLPHWVPLLLPSFPAFLKIPIKDTPSH